MAVIENIKEQDSILHFMHTNEWAIRKVKNIRYKESNFQKVVSMWVYGDKVYKSYDYNEYYFSEAFKFLAYENAFNNTNFKYFIRGDYILSTMNNITMANPQEEFEKYDICSLFENWLIEKQTKLSENGFVSIATSSKIGRDVLINGGHFYHIDPKETEYMDNIDRIMSVIIGTFPSSFFNVLDYVEYQKIKETTDSFQEKMFQSLKQIYS